MEQAARGSEVLVSRRGRPYVRLVGPAGLAGEIIPVHMETSLGFPIDVG
jgi:antitoxin (DNA-binding transcriptional repressor) of toxin-antitoxin stability system